MDVEHAIRTLHTVRKFSDEPVAEGDLTAILNAGRRAGSSKNLQRWHFIVIRDRETLTRLAEVGPFAGHLAGGVLAIALVTPDPAGADSPLSVMWDLGRAAENMVLMAWSRGLGSVAGDRLRAGGLPIDPGIPNRSTLRIHPEYRPSGGQRDVDAAAAPRWPSCACQRSCSASGGASRCDLGAFGGLALPSAQRYKLTS